MLRVGAKDKSTDGTFTLSPLEATTLNVILKAFIRSLADADIRKDTIRGLNTSGRSLRGVCGLAEDVEQSKKKLLKFLDKNLRSKDLDFYRNVVQKNMDPNQIEVLRASYNSHPILSQWTYKPMIDLQSTAFLPLKKQANNNQSSQSRLPTLPTSTVLPSNEFRRSFKPTLVPKDFPDRSLSKNPFINGHFTWKKNKGQSAFCVKCGELGHMGKDHNGPNNLGPVLPA